MKYNEKIWSDLNQDEKLAYHIYEEFQKKTRQRGNHTVWLASASAKSCPDPDIDGLRPAHKIVSSKNWKYFIETREMFKNDLNFDPQIFMDSVFHNLSNQKKIFPAQLRTKKLKDQYYQYKKDLKKRGKISSEKQLMESFASTYKFVSRKLGKKDLDYDDLYSFFCVPKDGNIIPEGIFFAMQEWISPYYLSISNTFYESYFNLDEDIKEEIISLDRLQDMAAFVKMKTKAYQFAKKLFKEDVA